MQGHVAAVVAVTRHKFASLLGLVGDPAEVEGLPFVVIVVLAVKALVSANKQFSFILTNIIIEVFLSTCHCHNQRCAGGRLEWWSS